MSTITPLLHPLPGEQLLALSPASAEEAARTWRRRPNLLPGRSLTASALEIRQQLAAGVGVLQGQAFTAGVVRGLEVELLPARGVLRVLPRRPLTAFVPAFLGHGVRRSVSGVVRGEQPGERQTHGVQPRLDACAD